MKTIKNIEELRAEIKKDRKNNLSIGFVPTMGALHQGHLSLVKSSLSENNITVVSIFLNPAQFSPDEDLEKYPRKLDNDKKMLISAGVDYLFLPTPQSIYSEDFDTWVTIPGLSSMLCGKSRPEHFKGVLTVVNKLFNIVKPDQAYFGKKDYQQLALIKKMTKELNMNISVKGCPLIRDNDGLALSSRNQYLSEVDRISALALSRSLFSAREIYHTGEKDPLLLIKHIKKELRLEKKIKIDYTEIKNKYTLQSVDLVDDDCIILAAVYLNNVRLIDNLEIFQK